MCLPEDIGSFGGLCSGGVEEKRAWCEWRSIYCGRKAASEKAARPFWCDTRNNVTMDLPIKYLDEV